MERINAELRTVAVRDLRPEAVTSWLAQLGRDGLASGAIRDAILAERS